MATLPALFDWLDDYEPGEQLEANAFTATFAATRKGDQRPVIIKTVKPGLRKPDPALALLSREHEVVSNTEHPVLPTLIETVRESSRIALVYARAKGHRLSDVIDRKPKIRPASSLAIATALASVLAALHRAGYVHARLRAESVELTEQGGVILFDPGGVGARGAGGDPDLDAPENMAPEQVLGQAAGPETDIYLLGKLLYQLIAGKVPFTAATGGITQQIRHAEPPSLHSVAPDAPRELQRIVSRCLRKRGRDRYPDMVSLQSELLRVMRAQTSLGREHLVAAALADVGLSAELALPRERDVARGAASAPAWLATAVRWGAGAVAAGIVIAAGWWLLGEDEAAGGHGARGILKQPALIRVLAQPWAEVHIDGELVDVTPVGRPIEVSPGPHVVVFKHPYSEPVTREIEIIAGQMILLDVVMPVVRPPDAGVTDAGSDAGPDAEAP